MARIIYTALVESIRGSIKGTTFQRNAYGHTVKAKPNMVNPNSAVQKTFKSNFALMIGGWRMLTDSERSDWNTYANTFPVTSRKNPSANLNGFNMFGRYHGVKGVWDPGAFLGNPSGAQGTIGEYTVTMTRTGGTLIFETDLFPEEGPWRGIVFLTRPLTPTQRFLKSWSRIIFTFDANGATGGDIATPYIAKFGVLPLSGDLVGMRLVIQNLTNGQISFEQPVILTVA